jgi:hypothetical protein
MWSLEWQEVIFCFLLVLLILGPKIPSNFNRN